MHVTPSHLSFVLCLPTALIAAVICHDEVALLSVNGHSGHHCMIFEHAALCPAGFWTPLQWGYSLKVSIMPDHLVVNDHHSMI